MGGFQNRFAIPFGYRHHPKNTLWGFGIAHAFKGTPIGVLKGYVFLNGALKEGFQTLVAVDAFAAEEELFNGCLRSNGFFTQSNTFNKIFVLLFAMFALFECKNLSCAFDGHMLNVVLGCFAPANGCAQVLQFFPNIFLAFG